MMKKKLFAVIAVLLVLAVTVPAAMAYFSTYVRVKGGVPVTLGESTQFKEERTPGGGKHVVVTASEGSDPVFVRVTAFAPSDMEDLVKYTGEGWTEGDGGFWYYSKALNGGESAAIDIDVDTEALDARSDRDTFDLVVVYEYVAAKTDANGNLYADWDEILEIVEEDVA